MPYGTTLSNIDHFICATKTEENKNEQVCFSAHFDPCESGKVAASSNSTSTFSDVEESSGNDALLAHPFIRHEYRCISLVSRVSKLVLYF